MLISTIRTILIYTLLVVAIRLMGKRQLGQLDPEEFVVTMLLANLATVPMEDSSVPILWGIVPIFTVISMELLLSGLAWKSIGLRRWIHGKPVILIENGRLCAGALRRTRITMDELCRELRCQNVLDITTVQYAILETNGAISLFLFPKFAPASARDARIPAQSQRLPVTLVSEGKILAVNLKIAQKDRFWLDKTLATLGTDLENTWYLAVEPGGRVTWLPKEGSR